MFTGIVAAVGQIKSVAPRQDGVHLVIDAGTLDLGDVSIGDSIAISGVCLTVVCTAGNCFSVDVSEETLKCVAGLDAPGEVNLERALRLSDVLGGHLVSGHVDGVGEVTRFEPTGESSVLAVNAPSDLARYIARKGSIAIDGVSLTVNEVAGSELTVNVIPHTLEVTTLKRLKPGARVNLEIDLIARYVSRFLEASNTI